MWGNLLQIWAAFTFQSNLLHRVNKIMLSLIMNTRVTSQMAPDNLGIHNYAKGYMSEELWFEIRQGP
jgi:hypothetical protein